MEDNIPAINLAQNEQTKGRTKHISIKTRFVYQNIQLGNIHIKHIGSSNNLADCLTKALSKRLFTQQRNLIVFSSDSSGIWGGVGKSFVGEILNKHGCTSGKILEKDGRASSQNSQKVSNEIPKDSDILEWTNYYRPEWEGILGRQSYSLNLVGLNPKLSMQLEVHFNGSQLD